MEYLEELQQKFDKLLIELKDELSMIRTNRPTPKLIEDIYAEYADESLPIKQLGSIAVELPRNLLVTPWDKGSIPAIAKSIENAKLGVTSSVQGSVVRITLPELTDERKEELSRIVKKIAEEIRIKMRIVRDDANKKVNAEQNENIKFRNKEKLQKSVDAFNGKVEDFVDNKLVELNA